MALIRRIDSSGLVKGYIDDGNFDGFLIHARKGLLKLPRTDSGRKEGKEEKNEKKVCLVLLFFFSVALAECERKQEFQSSTRSFFLSCYSPLIHITPSSSSICEFHSVPLIFLLYAEIRILYFITRDPVLWSSYDILIRSPYGHMHGKDNGTE